MSSTISHRIEQVVAEIKQLQRQYATSGSLTEDNVQRLQLLDRYLRKQLPKLSTSDHDVGFQITNGLDRIGSLLHRRVNLTLKNATVHKLISNLKTFNDVLDEIESGTIALDDAHIDYINDNKDFFAKKIQNPSIGAFHAEITRVLAQADRVLDAHQTNSTEDTNLSSGSTSDNSIHTKTSMFTDKKTVTTRVLPTTPVAPKPPVSSKPRVLPTTPVASKTPVSSKPRVLPTTPVASKIPVSSKPRVLPTTPVALKTSLISATHTVTKDHMDATIDFVTNDCTQLFDPCTREALANMSELESRVQELKRAATIKLEPLESMPAGIKTRLELLLYVLNRGEKPSITLLNYRSYGQLYEAYWDIAICMGMVDAFPITDEFYMLSGKKAEEVRNIEDPHFKQNRIEYLKNSNVNEGASGVSDITFMYKQGDNLTHDSNECSPPIVSLQGKNPVLYYCSSKYFKQDARKGVDKFDIQNIVTAFHKLPSEYNRKIVLLVKNKVAVEDKLKRALRRYIADEASFIFGLEDLLACLNRLYDVVHSIVRSPVTEDSIRVIFNIKMIPKPFMHLRLHQHMAVNKIVDAIQLNATVATVVSNRYLVGILPRGGKTYIAGGIIQELQPQNVVVLLGAKSETLRQFKDELFDAFSNFNTYTCIDVVSMPADFEPVASERYIFIMSVELFKIPESSRKLLTRILNGSLKIGLFICDEAHLKQTTRKGETAMATASKGVSVKEPDEETDRLQELDRRIQEQARKRNIPVVYMTGTYIKPKTALLIPDNQTVLWEYEDVQMAKQLSANEGYFHENFGSLYKNALEKCQRYGETIVTIEAQYKRFPALTLITSEFSDDAKAAFSKHSHGGVSTLPQLFHVKSDFEPRTVNPDEWYKGFANPAGVLQLLNYLCPKDEQIETTSEGIQISTISSVMNRINHIAQMMGDRLAHFTSSFVTHSQLWFLPSGGPGQPLRKRLCALAGAIFQIPWFRRNFDIVAVSSHVDWSLIPGANDKSIKIRGRGDAPQGIFRWTCPDNREWGLKGCLTDVEQSVRRGNKGLIILTQDMLHLGISLKCVDIVVLLDDDKSADTRIQKMYRSLTESTGKKCGFVVDLNYFRTVNALLNYAIETKKARKGRVHREHVKQLYGEILDIYSFDVDTPGLKTKVERKLPELERLMRKHAGRDGIVLDAAGNALNRNVDLALTSMYDPDAMSSLFGKLRTESRRILRKDETDVERATVISHGTSREGDSEEDSDSSERVMELFPSAFDGNQKRMAYLEMFKTTMKFGAMGTNAATVDELISRLENDPKLRDIVYDTLIKRGIIVQQDTLPFEMQRDGVIDDVVIPGLRKMKDDGKETSYVGMRDAIEDDSKYPAAVQSVLEYIRDNLAPKDVERHKYGEVFTPMTLVHEMLDTLNDKGVWSNKNLTWLDPANGMGNYPIAVFMRLCYGFRVKGGAYIGIGPDGEGEFNPGLTKIIPDEADRRAHIVKHMLFMVELNMKNNAIAKRLFAKLAPGVTANIIQMHRVNGFLANVPMKFPNGTVNQFDIVMGNPPFQGGAVKSKTTSATRKMRKDLDVEQSKHSNLWIPFVKKILTTQLKPNGFLLFIHPIGWFKPDKTGIHDLMMAFQICNLRIFEGQQSQKIFSGKGKINAAYYLLQNAPINTTTKITDRTGITESVQLTSTSIIALAINSIFTKIQQKASLFFESDDLKQLSINKTVCSIGTSKQLHRISETGEITFVKTSVNHKFQHDPKLIISGYHNPRIFFDKAGEFGLIGTHQHYFIGKNLNKLEDYFKTKLSALLLKQIKFDQEFIEPKYYPDIRDIPVHKITDETLADYFGFTKKERELINATHYPKREYKFREITCAQLRKEKPEATPHGGQRYTRKMHRKSGTECA